MPLPLMYLYIAERFGMSPWEIEDAPADRLTYWINIMSIEAGVKDKLADVGWDDVLIGFWDDDE